MTFPLEQRFRTELYVLAEVLSNAKVQGNLSRLNELHEYAEVEWWEYVERLRSGLVNYLLIAEAPP